MKIVLDYKPVDLSGTIMDKDMNDVYSAKVLGVSTKKKNEGKAALLIEVDGTNYWVGAGKFPWNEEADGSFSIGEEYTITVEKGYVIEVN